MLSSKLVSITTCPVREPYLAPRLIFFMLNSTEHEISAAHKNLKKFLALSLSDVVFIMLINVKMPTIVGILTFMSRINFELSMEKVF